MPAKKKPAKAKKSKKTKVTKEKKATKKEKKEEETGKKIKSAPELLRGFRDILPEEQPAWDLVRDTARSFAESYSFQRIDLPILEPVSLFIRTVGQQTDIVEKEMYTFEDPSGSKVALRPEATASVARAYINHGMLNRPQPVKLWYMGPMFRHDRPQAGRYRQFHQFGFESIGSDEPIIDAQLILILNEFFRELGIDITVQINSIGTPASRQAYLTELVSYFRPHRSKLGDDDKRRLQKNPLRLLDSKDEAVQELLSGAPQIVDWIDDDSKQHFMRVLEFLDEVDVPYVLNPFLVRGLDYYSKTVFEIWQADDDGTKGQTALGGGGRYDTLIELLGGERETPACGFAVGMDRVARILQMRENPPQPRVKPAVFFAQLGDAARRVGLKMFEEFRKEGIPVAEASGKSALKAQLEVANKLGVSLTLILGQKEVLDGTVIIRDMESGAQEIVDAKKIVSIVKKKLQGQSGVNPTHVSPVDE